MAVVNTTTQPGGYVADGLVNSSEAAAGTLGSVTAAGAQAHKSAPHKQPASK